MTFNPILRPDCVSRFSNTSMVPHRPSARGGRSQDPSTVWAVPLAVSPPKRASVSAGPPLAVRRFASPRFPLEFEIGQANVMIPSMRFEGAIKLTARLDSDGNAMTRLPGDLSGAVATPLSPGAEGALLTLDQKL